MRVLLAGASGVVGRGIAAQLAQSPDVTELVLTSRERTAAERVASVLGWTGITTESLDVTDTARVIDLARDADVFVCAAGPYYSFEPDVVRASIEAGTHYVSVADDHPIVADVMRLDADARAAGVTVISGCGLSPGITNLLVTLAASELDDVEEIDIAVAASSVDSPGTAATEHFLATMAEPAVSISDHTLEESAPGTSPKLVYFPEPVGWVETFRTTHPEIATLPSTYPDLRSLRYRYGLTERAVMDAIRASVFARLLTTQTRRRLWLKLAEPLRPVLESIPPQGAPWTAARVDVRGRSGAVPTTISLAVVDHLVNLTAVPAARAAIEVGKGTVAAGVLPPESAFQAGLFLTEIGASGLRIARLDPATV